MFAANGRFTLSAATAAKERERKRALGKNMSNAMKKNVNCDTLFAFPLRKLKEKCYLGEEVYFLPNHSSVLLLLESNPGCTVGERKV